MQITNHFLHGHSNEALLVTGATGQRSGAPEIMKLTLAVEDEADEDEEEGEEKNGEE